MQEVYRQAPELLCFRRVLPIQSNKAAGAVGVFAPIRNTLRDGAPRLLAFFSPWRCLRHKGEEKRPDDFSPPAPQLLTFPQPEKIDRDLGTAVIVCARVGVFRDWNNTLKS